MKDKLFHILKLISVPLILAVIYLSMFLIWRLFDLPTDEQLIVAVRSAFEKHGLFVVFVSALVEGFLLLGQYFPGGVIIFLGVISAGNNVGRATEVVAVVSVAFIISYTLNYLVGKYGWYKLFTRFGLNQSLEKAKDKVNKHGPSTVFFSYWEPNLASLTATAAGILNVPMKKFQIYSTIGVIGWNIFWGTLVFLLGESALKITGLKYVLIIFVIWVTLILLKSYIKRRVDAN